MKEEDILDHYELALKIIAESSPETDSVDDLKRWYGSIRLLANNAIQHNPLDMEMEDALKAGSKNKGGRIIRLKK